jgi:hypothetical protein
MDFNTDQQITIYKDKIIQTRCLLRNYLVLPYYSLLQYHRPLA